MDMGRDMDRGGLVLDPLLTMHGVYRGTSLIRKHTPLGPYSRTLLRDIWWS